MGMNAYPFGSVFVSSSNDFRVSIFHHPEMVDDTFYSLKSDRPQGKVNPSTRRVSLCPPRDVGNSVPTTQTPEGSEVDLKS